MRQDGGQSLVELAAALPLLLLILIGIFDVGRVMYYAIALSNGVHEGAAYAASLATVDLAATEQRVCDGSGLAPLGQPCAGLDLVSAEPDGNGGMRVTATYDVDLIYAHLLAGLGARDPMRLQASATYPVVAR